MKATLAAHPVAQRTQAHADAFIAAHTRVIIIKRHSKAVATRKNSTDAKWGAFKRLAMLLLERFRCKTSPVPMDTRPRLCAVVLVFERVSIRFLQDEQPAAPPRRKHSSVVNVANSSNEAFVTFLLRIRLIDGHDLVIRDASG